MITVAQQKAVKPFALLVAVLLFVGGNGNELLIVIIILYRMHNCVHTRFCAGGRH